MSILHVKMNLRGPTSMRKADGLHLIFIDFYVRALILLNSTEISLKPFENIYTGGVITRETYRHTRCSGHFILYILYNVGDRMKPGGTLFVGQHSTPGPIHLCADRTIPVVYWPLLATGLHVTV
jgi:hypothetical protein